MPAGLDNEAYAQLRAEWARYTMEQRYVDPNTFTRAFASNPEWGYQPIVHNVYILPVTGFYFRDNEIAFHSSHDRYMYWDKAPILILPESFNKENNRLFGHNKPVKRFPWKRLENNSWGRINYWRTI